MIVTVTQAGCPCCGGALKPLGVERAYVTDLPRIVRPQVTAYEVAVCQCLQCGKTVKGSHPDLAPFAVSPPDPPHPLINYD